MTSTRPREGRGIRHTAGGEHDRLKRAVLQPVQCWDKKWTESKNGKQLLVYKWVKSDRQVELDDDDDEEEMEQAPAPRQTEEEVGTPAPALPTLQDADDTTASTPAQTGEDDDEDDADVVTKPSSHPPSHSEHEKRTMTAMHPESATQKLIREESKGPRSSRDGDDDEDDTESNRPLVFTPSLETPIETQANTPQDFESMSPAPVESDSDLKREVAVDMVVKGLDEGQAEMEEAMEEVVVKEKEHPHPNATDNIDPQLEGSHGMDVESAHSTATAALAGAALTELVKDTANESSMDIDPSA
ncbi:hypothetical protein BGZ70_000323 [Mortierella alpina]|uniref:Uncharacterized protein n=1 Tax=Mortierella alpina TaxID=64518 RepID=A0A9P6IYJ2_MORAP|nr:hypothetical protein BGZ70_000323 [Mortierella alpina]